MKTADFDVAAMAPLFMTPAAGVAPQPHAPVPPPPAPIAATQIAPVAGPSRPVSVRAPAWLSSVGELATKRPLPVAAAAVLGSLVLALALVGVARLAGTPRESSPAIPAKSPPAATMAPAASIAASSAAGPAGTAPSAQVTPADPRQVLDATSHLVSGRHGEAQAAFQGLADTDPTNKAYAGIARLLQRSNSPRCQQKPRPSSCPEVIP